MIEKAPEIIQNLVDAIVENAPKLLEAAFEIIVKLVEGIAENLPEILDAGADIVFSILEGITQLLGDLIMKGKDIVDSVKEGFSQKVDEAKTWGKDLVKNFIDGITEKWEALKKKVAEVAQTVKDYLGFSEPKKGPLSNFHTYAPDMMELFAKGITDNENVIKSAFEKSLNFGTSSVDFASSGLGVSSSGVINGVASSNEYNSVGGKMTINLMFPDGTRIASYLLPNLIDVARAGGTPIVNPS